MLWDSSMISADETGSCNSDTFPDSIFSRSRTSLISYSGRHWRGEAEDRIQRTELLMAQAGQEV